MKGHACHCRYSNMPPVYQGVKTSIEMQALSKCGVEFDRWVLCIAAHSILREQCLLAFEVQFQRCNARAVSCMAYQAQSQDGAFSINY